MLFALPSVLFLVTLGPRRWVRQGWVAVHMLAVMVVAAMYFGGTRHRASYDLLFLFFAFEVYAAVGAFAWARIQRWRAKARVNASRASATQSPASGPSSPHDSSSS